MPLVLADRVNETTTTTSTGTLTLAGAVSGYQSFAVIGNGNTTYYTIVHQTANEWEVGIGTYTSSGTTLSRDTVLASSNSGSLVNFSAGTKFVFCDYPAGRAVYLDTATNVTIPGLTLSGGTANGVLYLNASKVATSGSALVFNGTNLGVGRTPNNFSGITATTPILDVDGTIQVRSSGGINLGGGTWRKAAINSPGGTDTPYLAFSTATSGASSAVTERLRIDNSGNVGIGTSSPAYDLQVKNIGLYTTSTANTYYLLNDGSFKIAQAGVGSRVTLDSSGNLGLGVTPSAWSGYGSAIMQLPNAGTIVSNNQFAYFGANWYYNGGFKYISSSAASYYGQDVGAHKWYTAASGTAGNAITFTQAMTLDASGNLGLGVTPSAWRSVDVALQVRRACLWDDNNNAMYLGHNVFENSSGNYIYIGTDFATKYRQFDGTHAWLNAPSGTAGGTISFTQAMTLSAAGNLGIGTTSWPSGQRLRVAGGDVGLEGQYLYLVNANANIQLGAAQNSQIINDDSGNLLTISRTGASSIITFSTAGSERARISSAGGFSIGTTTDPGAGKLVVANGIVSTRIDPRVVTAASASSLTPDISAADQYNYTALAATLTINAPIGTPVDGNKLTFRILDNGTSRTLSWNATFTAIGVTIPTATTANKTTYVGCVYNANNTRWDVIAVTTQA